jgi:hypothetical protein
MPSDDDYRHAIAAIPLGSVATSSVISEVVRFGADGRVRAEHMLSADELRPHYDRQR